MKQWVHIIFVTAECAALRLLCTQEGTKRVSYNKATKLTNKQLAKPSRANVVSCANSAQIPTQEQRNVHCAVKSNIIY